MTTSTERAMDSGRGSVERIYTKLKFVRSEKTGLLVSFISTNPKTGRVCGVREDSEYPKKICVVDKAIAETIVLNVLYDCTLVPMKDRNGYVVVAAEPVQFKAHISTSYIKGSVYRVEVKFGNKTVRFDPFDGRTPTVYVLKLCKKVLEKRFDVQDLMQVVEDFEKAGLDILDLMKKDKVVPAHARSKG